MSEDFSVFSTIRYDESLRQVARLPMVHAGWNHLNESPFYMLDYHRDRLLQAASHWNWDEAIKKLSDENFLANFEDAAGVSAATKEQMSMRFKLLVSNDGTLSFEKGPTKAKALANLFPTRLPPPESEGIAGDPEKTPCFTLLVDSELTDASQFTHYKTTRRAMYDAARKRAGIALTDLKEVLVINSDDSSVMEGTIFTPYFWRSGRWVTPPVSAGFQQDEGSGGQEGTTRRWALER